MKITTCDACGDKVETGEEGTLVCPGEADTHLCPQCEGVIVALVESGALKDPAFVALYGPDRTAKRPESLAAQIAALPPAVRASIVKAGLELERAAAAGKKT